LAATQNKSAPFPYDGKESPWPLPQEATSTTRSSCLLTLPQPYSLATNEEHLDFIAQTAREA
jgi:hypothetical protein